VDRARKGACVYVVVTSPGRNSIVTQAFTSPFAVRAVSPLHSKVKFLVEERTLAGG
jgi:hypothetical protein